MANEYVMLKSLRDDVRYKALQELWVYQISKVEEARDRAAGRGQESAWRYRAGIEKGFKLAMTALERALVDMEKKDENAEEQSVAEKMLEELRVKREGINQ